ncbi:MAG: protein kinase [Polyangia bacterium]
MSNVTMLQTGITQLTCKDLRAETTYELVAGSDQEGCAVPVLLGRGRFAKVYKAWQKSAGHNVRPVAIKILHENIDRRSEHLFLQEIHLNKMLTSSAGPNVISILDILQLGPMAMCGNCGQIYHPRCPLCGEHPLESYEPPNEAYSALRCRGYPRCKYMVSGDSILNSTMPLMQPPSKLCCANERSARAQRGTLINFVDRDAVVMELLGEGLPHFHRSRRRTFARLFHSHGVVFPATNQDEPDASLPDATTVTPPLRTPEAIEVEFLKRVLLLEKTLIMVQLAEAVAWLHGEKQIVHKDLAPDNIMVCTQSTDDEPQEDWRGLSEGTLCDALTSLANYSEVNAKVIDFGLADHVYLSRNWYEEPVSNFATEKLSYLSLEARQRRRRLYQRLDLDPIRRSFIVPDSLHPEKAGELAIKPGDLLVDESDPKSPYSLEITAVERDPSDPRGFRAHFKGEVPPNPMGRQFDLVLRLGEAHDVYALGAVFYFILTGEHTDVRKLTNIADLLQDAPQPLQADILSATMPSYNLCRDRIPEPFHQDDFMRLILRAMVRGQPESFATSRIERGPGPARKLLGETRCLYNELKAELLSSSAMQELLHLRQNNAQLQELQSHQSLQVDQLRNAHRMLHEHYLQTVQASRRQQALLMLVALLTGLLGAGAALVARSVHPAVISLLAPAASAQRQP